MIQISKCIPQGQGLAAVLLRRAAQVELDWDIRQKSRFEAVDSLQRTLGVFLPRGTVVRGGDVLVAVDGSLVRVIAAPQSVLKITHCTAHGTPFDLIRAAYHLGNRHVPIELTPDHLKIEPDHVLTDMLRAMHLIVSEVSEPFEPESGAYTSGGHDHGHPHAHDHHAHDHPVPGTTTLRGIPVAVQHPPHVHGPGCHHDHGHDHPHDQ